MLLALSVLGGCVSPRQYEGDIVVDADGFAARLDTLCELTAEAPSEECASYREAKNVTGR